MRTPLKSLAERVGHALAFEVIALALCAPLFGWLMGTNVTAMSALTLAISLVAMAWNVVYNAWFDRLQRRAACDQMHARGVEFTQEPVDRLGTVDAGFRDPSGNGWKMMQAPR
jgi:uncharacterized membrane protein